MINDDVVSLLEDCNPEREEVRIARKLFEGGADTRCSMLHMQWTNEHFWGFVAQKEFLPCAEKIYQYLNTHKITEDKKIDFNDLDDSMWFIPHKDKKIFVHTSQNLDSVFIIDGLDFHIRRIYRDFSNYSWLTAEDLTDINKILEHVPTLTECHDDHYQYSQRPSLNAFVKDDFEMKYKDFRDPGYILSYNSYYAKYGQAPRVEGAQYSISELSAIQIYLGSMIYMIEEELENG